jgi:hypothetical protein
MDDFTVNVRQLSQYPLKPVPQPTDLFLIQEGGLGGAYRSLMFRDFWTGIPGLVLGLLPPPSNKGLAASFATTPLGARQGYNYYVDINGTMRFLQNGYAGIWSFADEQLAFTVTSIGFKDQVVPLTLPIFQLGLSGQMKIAGQLEVARNPGRPNEVVTLDYLQKNAVASFDQMKAADVYRALGLDGCDPLVTQDWVNGAICAALQSWYYVTPLVFTFNGRVGSITLLDSDITAACTAPGAMPRTVTPPPGDASSRIASTSFVSDAISDAEQDLQLSFDDIYSLLTTTYAPLASPVFTGNPTAPTANPGTSTGQIATTAYVMEAVAASVSGVSTFNGRSGNVVLTQADIIAANGWYNAVLTGNPTAPTPAAASSGDQVANCAWVLGELASVDAGVVTFNTRSGFVTLQAADISGAGGALLSSPTFIGTPSAPTAAPGTANNQLATTAFVAQSVGVASFNGRTGVVTLNVNDISAAGGAPIASPIFTGTPTVPTAAAATNNTQAASTAYVQSAVAQGVAQYWLGSGFLNKFYNGSFQIGQRGLTGTTNTIAVGPGFTLDGWRAGATGTTMPTWSQLRQTNFRGAALRFAMTAALSALQMYQRLESVVAQQLFNVDTTPGPVTVQFRVFNGTGANILPQITITAPSATDVWTGTLTNVIGPVNGAFIAPNTSAIVAYTFLPTAALAQGLMATLSFTSAGIGYIDIAEADIRATPGVATGWNTSPPPAAMRDAATELVFCERFYQNFPVLQHSGSVLAGTDMRSPLSFPPMRVLPTVSFAASNVQGSATGWNVVPLGVSSMSLVVSSTSGGWTLLNYAVTLSAEL